MKPVRVAFTLLAVLLVGGVIATISSETNLLVTTRTERFTTTSTSLMTITRTVNQTTTVSVYENVEICAATSYFIPDTIELTVSNVTIISGNVTSYSWSESQVYQYQNTTEGATTYLTFTYANNTIAYVTTSTSQNSNDYPSDGWTVTICTYRP